MPYKRMHTDLNIYCNPILVSMGKEPYPLTQWIQSDMQLDSIRKKQDFLCSSHHAATAINSATVRRRQYKLVIYHRDMYRKMIARYDIIDQIKDRLKLIDKSILDLLDIIVYYHSDNDDACKMKQLLSDADIVVTPHGFQSTSLIFMRKNSILIEFFNYKYYKETYYNMAKQYGIHYLMLQNTHPTSLSRWMLMLVSQYDCMNSKSCRSFAR